jgi:hypothetical protein
MPSVDPFPTINLNPPDSHDAGSGPRRYAESLSMYVVRKD